MNNLQVHVILHIKGLHLAMTMFTTKPFIMALALACESSYFRKSIFEWRYCLSLHLKLPQSIRKYIQSLWILQYYNTRQLSFSLFVKVLRYSIVAYDGGFRMPERGSLVAESRLPRAVPMAFYESNPILESKIPEPGTFLTPYPSIERPHIYEYIQLHSYYQKSFTCRDLFYSGVTPAYWENDKYILIGVTYTGSKSEWVRLGFIDKSIRHTLFLRLCDIRDLNIDPQILSYVIQSYKLTREEVTLLEYYRIHHRRY